MSRTGTLRVTEGEAGMTADAKQLAGRVAVVTGASRGLGEGIAKALARAGAGVALFSRSGDLMREHVARLRGEGLTAACYEVDVSVAEAVEQAFDKAEGELGPVDILVNNAAIAPSTPFLDVSDQERDAVFATNINGVWNCTRRAVPGMMERRSGKIINISSVTGPIVSGKGMCAYSASKGAVSALTRALALELAGHGINVNAICPGSFATPMMRDLAQSRGQDPDAYLAEVGRTIPLGRMGTMEEAGDLAVFLASDRSRYMTGEQLVLDGGNVIQEH